MTIFAAVSLVMGLVSGCATSSGSRAEATPALEGDGPLVATGPGESPADPQAVAAAVVPAAPPVDCEARLGADRLRRSSLKRTVDAGFGRWLQTVSVDPLVTRGHFKGWIIRSLNSADRCYAGLDIRPGDVVTRVNGRGVERPEEALEVWTKLPAAPELVIDLLRDGEARTVRFGIVDQ